MAKRAKRPLDWKRMCDVMGVAVDGLTKSHEYLLRDKNEACKSLRLRAEAAEAWKQRASEVLREVAGSIELARAFLDKTHPGCRDRMPGNCALCDIGALLVHMDCELAALLSSTTASTDRP